ncbi:hypothetical protein SAMN06297468_2878 [Altererythrobacter xiamenensis]|uniref:DUF1579 domain-containing protein n=1 Tax=Altererythrobacter xiamenensis TaxID=1316679 RepID=A0A1Y6FPG9_9SPHN|nr:hypothetical protein [Altererythrobacter xiamenensis]SMQ74702.1 hypothetical protein SAMN06297468_2878 [Altererythrobacter xiamenensis]
MSTTLAAIIAIFQAASVQTQPPTPPSSPPPACDTEGHAGFDFWVGEWDVYAARDLETKVADSRIERKHNGCAVIESWMPLRGQGGTSLNHYDVATQRWHQKWVGQAPGAVYFEGGVVDGTMVLTGYWPNGAGAGQDALTRMSYKRREDDSVRQHGEASTDHGLSWQTSFDFIYKPKQDAAK